MTVPFGERHILGAKTRERVIRSERSAALSRLGFALLGLCHAERPYSMSTLDASRAFVLTCIGGRGRVWVGGRWQFCHPGESYLCPKGGAHAYETLAGESWQFVWSLYDAPSPWLRYPDLECRHVTCDHALALHSAVEGLYREINGPCEERFAARWAEMIHAYWRSTAEGRQSGKRLALLWEKVDSSLAHHWTVEELAKIAGFSGEHLRRLCLAETGRSPMEQVTRLRMQRAELLLQARQLTIAAIAEMVGYSPFAFTAAYRKWTGHPPSAQPGRVSP